MTVVADARSPVELVDAARRGDSDAWDQLFLQFNGLVVATARRCGLGPEESADVAQTTWLQLFQRVESIRNGAALPAWLATTTVREAVAVSRRRARETPDCDAVDRWSPLQEDDVETALDTAHLVEHLYRALPELPRRERELLRLLLSPEQPSYREVSRLLQMPVGAIGPVRQRAMRRLRDRLWAHRDLL